VTYALPVPAGITGPVNNSTNVTNSTMFEFTTTPDQIYEVYFDNSTARFKVFTTTGSVTIPNIPEMSLPTGGASYTWTVTGYGPHATMDQAADAVPLEDVSKTDFDGSVHSLTTNPTRSFTTQ
jgi:hypothetical protein